MALFRIRGGEEKLPGFPDSVSRALINRAESQDFRGGLFLALKN